MEKDLNKLDKILNNLSPNYPEMSKIARQYWKENYSPDVIYYNISQKINAVIVSSLSMPTSLKNEVSRMNSFRTYWSNSWTLPQRIHIKIKIIFRSVFKLGEMDTAK